MNTTRTLAIWMALGGTASASSTIAFDGGDWTTSCADTDIDDSDHTTLEDAWDAVQDDCAGVGTVTGDAVSASIVHVTARSTEAMYLATTATSEDETTDIVAYLDNTRVFTGRSGRSAGFRLMADFEMDSVNDDFPDPAMFAMDQGWLGSTDAVMRTARGAMRRGCFSSGNACTASVIISVDGLDGTTRLAVGN